MRRLDIRGLLVSASLIATSVTAAIADPASWTGPYLGGTLGWNWADSNVGFSPNDASSAGIIAGTLGGAGEQPLNNSFKVQQRSGLGAGFEGGYNWQAANWLLGVEADISFTSLSGMGSSTSLLALPAFSQSFNGQQSTNWYGTVRGRLGWLATPDLLIFGTGGFAYGRVGNFANYTFNGPTFATASTVGFSCTVNITCFSGGGTSTKTGWTAGGGAELRLSQSVTVKIEYLFIDLGSETFQVTALNSNGAAVPSSFNATMRNDIQVVRGGFNVHLN